MGTASHIKPAFFSAAQLMGSGWQQASNSRHNFPWFRKYCQYPCFYWPFLFTWALVSCLWQAALRIFFSICTFSVTFKFFVCLVFLLWGRSTLCTLFLAGLLKCELNFFAGRVFIALCHGRVPCSCIYLIAFISVSQRNLEYAAVNHVLFFYAIIIFQLVNFFLCVCTFPIHFFVGILREGVCVHFHLAVGIYRNL